MRKLLSFPVVAMAFLSLASCTGMSSAANSGDSGVTASSVGSGAYQTVHRCPADATTLSGQSWRPGEYCVPGGRRS